MTEKTRERKARRQLASQCYQLQKSINKVSPLHTGCYRIIDTYFNRIEAGENYDLSIDDVEAFIAEME